MKKYLLLFFLMCLGSPCLLAQSTTDTTLIGKRVRVTTTEKIVVEGVVLSENEKFMQIQIDSAKAVMVAKPQIKEISRLDQKSDQAHAELPGQKTQHAYFLNSTALPFEKNTFQFDITSTGLISAAVNVSSRFSIAVRNLFFKAFDINCAFNTKVAPKASIGLRLGSLWRYEFFSRKTIGNNSGINFSMKLTLGTERHNISMGLGRYTSFSFFESGTVFTLSGMTHLSKNFLLIGDGTFIPEIGYGGFGTGFKFLGNTDWSFDIGCAYLFFPKTKSIELPFTYTYRPRQANDHLFLPMLGFHKKF